MPGESKIRNLQGELVRWKIYLAALFFVLWSAFGVVDFVERQRASQKKVLWFNIPMNEFLTPQKFQTRRQASHEPAREFFGQPSGLACSDQSLDIASPAVF